MNYKRPIGGAVLATFIGGIIGHDIFPSNGHKQHDIEKNHTSVEFWERQAFAGTATSFVSSRFSTLGTVYEILNFD